MGFGVCARTALVQPWKWLDKTLKSVTCDGRRPCLHANGLLAVPWDRHGGKEDRGIPTRFTICPYPESTQNARFFGNFNGLRRFTKCPLFWQPSKRFKLFWSYGLKASMVGFTLVSRFYCYLRRPRRSPDPPFPPDEAPRPRPSGHAGEI